MDGSRKTLVGLTPLLPASDPPLATRATYDREEPSAAEPALLPGEAAADELSQTAIAGSPIRPISVVSRANAGAKPTTDTATLARPSNPTVPFPKPELEAIRSAPRARESGSDTQETAPPAERRSSGTTQLRLETLERRPQLIAMAAVCSIATLIIFAMWGSPVSSTAGIQSRKLASQPVNEPSPLPSPPPSGEPTEGPRLRPGGGVTSLDPSAVPTPDAAAREPSTLGRELAPGLRRPEASPKAPVEGASAAAEAPRSADSGTAPGALEPSGVPAAPAAPSTQPTPTRRSQPPPPKPPRPAPRPKRPAATKPAPSSNVKSDFDFGI